MRGFLFLAAALVVGLTSAPGVASAAVKHHDGPNGPSAASFYYNTTGAVDVQAAPISVSGPATLQFQGVTAGVYTAAAGLPIQLGQFVVPASTTTYGSATTFTNTPFEVQVTAPEFDKTSSVPLLDKVFPSFGKSLHLKTVTTNSLIILGKLNGTVDANGQEHVAATIDSIKLGGLGVHTQDHITRYAFPIRFSQLKLPSSWTSDSPLVANAASTVPVPPAQTYASTSAAKVQAAPAAETLIAGPAQPIPTPEPSTFLIFAAALGAFAVARRRASR